MHHPSSSINLLIFLQDLQQSVFNAEMIEEQGFDVNMDPLIRRLERSHLMPAAELSQVLKENQETVNNQKYKKKTIKITWKKHETTPGCNKWTHCAS